MQFRVAICPLFSPLQFSKIVETTFCMLQKPIWKQKNESGRGAGPWLAGLWMMGKTRQGRRSVDQKPPVFLRLGLYILKSDWVREGQASASCGIMGISPNLCVFIISSLKEAPEIDDLYFSGARPLPAPKLSIPQEVSDARGSLPRYRTPQASSPP